MDAAETFLLKVAVHALGVVVSPVIARGLGPQRRGAYYLPFVAAATMAAACALGLEQANVYLRGTRRLSLDRLSGQSGLVAFGAGGIGPVLLLPAPALLPGLFAETTPLMLLLAGLTIPVSVLVLSWTARLGGTSLMEGAIPGRADAARLGRAAVGATRTLVAAWLTRTRG